MGMIQLGFPSTPTMMTIIMLMRRRAEENDFRPWCFVRKARSRNLSQVFTKVSDSQNFLSRIFLLHAYLAPIFLPQDCSQTLILKKSTNC